MPNRYTSGSPRRSPGSPASPSAPWIAKSTPFVGRDVELDWLERSLKRAAHGEPRVCLISGDAGTGKTRISRKLADNAVRAGFRVCYGRGYEDFRVSYLPFEALLGELQTSAGEDVRIRAAAEALEGLFVRDVNAEAGEIELIGHRADSERLRAFHDIARGLIRHAQLGAVLLILEDLHWFDPSSLDLLSHIAFLAADASVSEPLPLLVVCTFRQHEAEQPLLRFQSRFQREEICESLALQGFDEDELAALIHALGISDPSHQLVVRLLQVTRGNPLFVEEILRHLLREGALVERVGRWETTLDVAELALPRLLGDAVATRARDLGADCRGALTLASFLGERFDLGGLSALANSNPDDLRTLLEEASIAGLVTSQGNEYEFTHSLTRQAFYTLPDRDRRREIHRQVADCLERRSDSETERYAQALADHWINGMRPGDEPRAVELASAAGDEAFRVFDWALAARHYEAALAANEVAGLLATDRHADLRYRAGVAEFRDMDADAALAHYSRAIQLFEECGDTRGRSRALLDQARTHLTLRSVPYGTLIDVDPLEGCLEDLGTSEPELSSYICATLADAYAIAKQPDRALRFGEQALEIGTQLGDDGLCAYARVALGNCHVQSVALDEARSCFEGALANARASGEAWTEGWALQRLPLTLAWLGRLDEADRSVREAAESAERINDWADHSLALGGQTAIAVARGDLERAETMARETLSLVGRTGYPWGGAIALTALAGARALRGLWTEANDALSILAEPGRVFEDPGHEMQFLVAVARLRTRAMAGEVDAECIDEAQNLLSLVKLTGPEIGTLAALCAFVEIAQRAQNASLAEKSLELLKMASERGAIFTAGCEYLLPRVMGVAEAVTGRVHEAEYFLRSAIELAERGGALPDLARSCVDLAAIVGERDGNVNREEALGLLARADQIFAEKKMAGVRDHAAAVAARIGCELPDDRSAIAADRDSSELEPIDREILEAVARGRDDREIGELLLLAPATVRARRGEIFERIGVAGRTGATAYALAQGDDAARRVFLPASSGGQAARRIILVSDIVGSTQLIESLGDAIAQQRVRDHNRLIRARARAHRGEEIQHTGDGFILAFENADSAVHCALSIQAALDEERRERGDEALAVRVGIHAGRALPDEGRLFGIAIHATFRVCDLAGSGEILVTEDAMGDCRDPKIEFEDVGPAALKGLSRPKNLFRVSSGGDAKRTA